MHNSTKQTAAKSVLDFQRPFSAFPIANPKPNKGFDLFKTIGSFPAFGILANDWILIKTGITWKHVEENSLYVVFTTYYRIAAIKFEENNLITLHDGLGGNFISYGLSSVDLIGQVLRGAGGEPV